MSDSSKSSGRGSDMIGQQIGNYVIEDLLGVGGMGQVFQARHKLLDRLVALKVMHANLAKDPAFQARFRQEAKSAAALRHPHIVEVFDFDEQDGYAYLVMELITGGSLRNLLQDGGRNAQDWSLDRGLELIRQSADALAYAHAVGMVHRDIKPDNLLLQNPPNGGLPVLKVGDFGLARMGEGSGLTAANTAMGTPAYMSPEQCQGQELDGRSDIYALGVVLYEVATGTLPFSIKTVSEAVFKHVYTTPTSPRQLRPDLPDALDGLIMRCLAKMPSERFASAADLAAALREVTANISPGSAAGSLLYSIPMISTQEGGQGTAYQLNDAGVPDVSTLPGRAALPRIQVLDEAGTLMQVVAIQPSGLSVGRMPSNDLQLDAQNVSRNHLRIAVEQGRVMVTDLGSRSGTQLGNVMLPAQLATEWPYGEMLRVGSYWLRLDPPTASSQPVDISRGATPQSQPPMPSIMRSFVSTGQISVAVSEELLALKPGQPTSVEVILTNASQVAEQLVLSVSGVPEEWVTLPPPVQVAANGQSSTRITISVPEDASAHAGEYPVEVRARSRTDRSEGGTMLVRWTVLPFARTTLSMTPARLEVRKRGQYRVTLRNEGNAPVTYRLSAADEAGQISFAFDDNQATIEPGESLVLPLKAETSLIPIGGSETTRAEVRAQSQDGQQNLVTSAAFVHVPLMPAWMGGIAGILLLLSVAGTFLSGYLNPSQPKPGATAAATQGAGDGATAAAQAATAGIAGTPGVVAEPTIAGPQPGTPIAATPGTTANGGASGGASGGTSGGAGSGGSGGASGGAGGAGSGGSGGASGGASGGSGGASGGSGGAGDGTSGGGAATTPAAADAAQQQNATATAQAQALVATQTALVVQQAATQTAEVVQRATSVAATSTAAANASSAQQTSVAATQAAELQVIQQTQLALQVAQTSTAVAQAATAQAQQTAAAQTAIAQSTSIAGVQQTALAEQTATAATLQTATAAVFVTQTAEVAATQTAIANIKNEVTNVVISPALPAFYAANGTLTVDFNYSTNDQAGAKLTVYGYNGASLLAGSPTLNLGYGRGSTSVSIPIFATAASTRTITRLRFLMFSNTTTTVIYDVYYPG